MIRPGLMIGHIDHFVRDHPSQFGDTPSQGTWLQICERAFQMWRNGMTCEDNA
jgi:hypothetical protein